MTGTQYAARWTELANQGMRPHDFESYSSGGTQLYAGIWVANTEKLSWSSRRDMTGAQYGQYFTEQSAAGRRPVDIEVYSTTGGLRYAAIWYQNVGNVSWVQLRDMSRATYQAELNAKQGGGSGSSTSNPTRAVLNSVMRRSGKESLRPLLCGAL